MIKLELEQVYQQEFQRIMKVTGLSIIQFWILQCCGTCLIVQNQRGERNTRSKSTHCAFQNFNLKEFASTVCHLFPRSMYLRVLHYLLDCDVTYHDIIVNIYFENFLLNIDAYHNMHFKRNIADKSKQILFLKFIFEMLEITSDQRCICIDK